MIEEPERHVEAFAKAGASILTVHPEATQQLHRTIETIRRLGVRPGVALNPGTSVSLVEDVLADVDLVLVMSVDPGFGGQEFIEGVLPKVRRLRRLLDERGTCGGAGDRRRHNAGDGAALRRSGRARAGRGHGDIQREGERRGEHRATCGRAPFAALERADDGSARLKPGYA